jgi:hypothetical protein
MALDILGTALNSTSSGKNIPGGKYNVLNDYRSYTPAFTLACLGKNALANPDSYRQSALDFVILKSGGKNKGFNVNATQGVVSVSTSSSETLDAKKLVSGFNVESPGRFDMFIDNLDFDCIIAPGEKQGSSTATQIKFEVFEPYSMNGFIEALHVAAVSAGFNSYTEAAYLLKVEFWGYPDKDQFSTPELVPNASRYFVFNFTGVEVTVTEQGTKYSCTGVPNGDLALSEPDKLLTDIKMSGTTVKEVLQDLFFSINKSLANRAKEEKDDSTNCDDYQIVFPKEADVGSTLDYSTDNVIAQAKMAPVLTTNSIFKMVPIEKKGKPGESKMADPKATTTSSDAPTPQSQGMKYEPNGNAIQFAQGTKISDAITAVIRDSTYLENILKDIKGSCDPQGRITYFLIQVDVVPKDKKDLVSQTPLNIYRYVIIPHKVHFTRLPLQKGVAHDPEQLMPAVNRVYNYIYTGKNVDVLNFNLKFNNLFFQAIPPKAGNEKNQEQAAAAGMSNTTKVAAPQVESKEGKKEVVPGSKPIVSNQSDGKTTEARGNRAGPPRTDPYYKFAEYAHNAILESVDQCTADLDIIGDPFYLVMGGIGNQKPVKASDGLTTDGTADNQGGDVMVRVNFKNPDDIDTSTGFMRFNPSIIPYSGIYRVIQVKTNFKDGNFKQTLSLIRIPGQITDDSVTPEDPKELKTTPKPGSQLTPDNVPAGVTKEGVRPSNFDITKLLSRGLPSIGLPGNLSDFSASGALGALGSLGSLGAAALSKVSGAVSSVGNIAGIAGQVGVPVGSSLSGLNALTNGLRATAVTVQGAGVATSGVGALIGGAGATLGSVSNIANPAASLANSLGVSSVVNLASPASAINDIKSKASAALGSLPNDPKAALAAAGVDPAQVAGLSPDLQSKVQDQISKATANIPADVDINTLKNSGVSLANIPASAMANIPPSAKALVAQAPALPDIVSPEALDKINRLNAASLASGSAADVTALAGKVGSADSLLSQVPGAASVAGLPTVSASAAQFSALAGGSAENSLNSIASVTGGNSFGGVSADSLSNLKSSVTSKFGSAAGNLVASANNISPLTKLVDNSNLG